MFKKVLKRTTLCLMALIVLAGIVLWAPDKSRVELENAYGTPKNSYVTALGVKIHYQDTGPSQNPIPILFLHGFGSSLHTWDAWTKDLSSKYRVISIDLPGFGLTGESPNKNYSEGQDLACLLYTSPSPRD